MKEFSCSDFNLIVVVGVTEASKWMNVGSMDLGVYLGIIFALILYFATHHSFSDSYV